MPELPEVETTRRGLHPHIVGQRITKLVIRETRLRWPIEPALESKLIGQTIVDTSRRGKYLLLHVKTGTLLVHLGMSGNLRILLSKTPALKHDHVDIVLNNGHSIRFNDPRRFGAIIWTEKEPEIHPLLAHLGPEPLSDSLSGAWLYEMTRGNKITIKLWLMDSKRITGIGNIYANEALFRSGILPTKAAGKISLKKFEKLAAEIKKTLKEAIEAGGSTLRDFVNAEGNPGYFQQKYFVYGREGQGCLICQKPVKLIRQAGRATYYCIQCQR